MKVSMIKKLNTIISLWLIAIIVALGIFGYELDMFGFYIAGFVFMAILFASNAFTLTNGIIHAVRKVPEAEPEYTKYGK